jgi:hypothetical protein
MAVNVGDGLFITPDVVDEEDERRIIELASQLSSSAFKGAVACGALLHPTLIAQLSLGWNGQNGDWTQDDYGNRFPDWLTALWWKLVGRGVVPAQVANILPDQVSRWALQFTCVTEPSSPADRGSCGCCLHLH